MINVIKKLYNDERNFQYNCLCSNFNIKRQYDEASDSYIDRIDYEYSECGHTHIPHTVLNKNYGLNSINLRSDELKVVKDGVHILFGGCSNTWGHEINKKEDLWSYIVNKNFENSSGYFNLARCGWNTSQIVADAIVYCNSYGMPKYMFLLFPDYTRETINFKMDMDKLHDKDKEYINLLQERSIFLAIMAIESFCETNNIELVYSTWHGGTTQLLARWNLKNYVPLFDINNVYTVPNLFFWEDLQSDGHWKEKHNKRFAEIILEKIK